MHSVNKVITVTGIFIIVLWMFPTTAASDTTVVYLYPDNYTANYIGETFPIQVKIYAVVDLTAYEFKVKFNTTFLKCLGTSIGNLLPPPPRSSYNINIDNNQGIIYAQVSLQPGENPASGSGSLLTITFNATSGTSYPWRTSCPLEIIDDNLYGTGEPPQIISHQTINGTYQPPYIPPTLNLTIQTSKERLFFNEKLTVTGGLTGNNYPIPDALIAFEVDTPAGKPIILRSFPTSSLPITGPVEILEVTPCDQYGTPKYNFLTKSFAYFKVTVKNNDSKNLNITITVNPYDSSNATLGSPYSPGTIAAGQTTSVTLSVPIEQTAMSGNAIVYANVFTDLPKNGGISLCLEKKATFTISGSTNGDPTIISPPPQGTYITIINIHYVPYSAGNYTIYTTAQYLGSYTTKSKKIQVSIVGDIDFDGKVGLSDLTILAKHYGHRPPDGHSPGTQEYVYCFNADIDGNGIVGLSDLVTLSKNYGKS
ncbi:MAG: cohesin domain-containing protein [Candidatus Bathyarchaeia archaeon]